MRPTLLSDAVCSEVVSCGCVEIFDLKAALDGVTDPGEGRARSERLLADRCMLRPRAWLAMRWRCHVSRDVRGGLCHPRDMKLASVVRRSNALAELCLLSWSSAGPSLPRQMQYTFTNKVFIILSTHIVFINLA